MVPCPNRKASLGPGQDGKQGDRGGVGKGEGITHRGLGGPRGASIHLIVPPSVHSMQLGSVDEGALAAAWLACLALSS